MIAQLGESDRLLIFKKPFDPVEVRQAACALATKWRGMQQMRSKMSTLEHQVAQRTRELQQSNEELGRLNRELAAARAAPCVFTPGLAGERQGPAVRD